MESSRTFGPMIFCDICSIGMNMPEAIPMEYFEGKKETCSTCGNQFDWKKLLTKNLQKNGFAYVVFAPLGGRLSIIEKVLEPNQQLTIDFEKNGVPQGANILAIDYRTQEGDLFPLEFRGTSPSSFKIGRCISLHPVSMWKRGSLTSTKVILAVTWMPQGTSHASHESLFGAYEAFHRDKYQASIIPANVAVESQLSHIMKSYISRFVSGETVDRFLNDGATYSHQLNVLLPLILGTLRIRKMDDNLRGDLNRLRKLRNEIGHDGKTKEPLTKEGCAELLVSSLIGFRFLELLETELSE